ncbi:hypothetical protein PIROE2DRAFT_67730 [Piromyces sp. E2]|nr:hypothetical protein PIROE2DRAFT_67730 [Piromyces sp. E2]|eukprot:OUM58840.1 hypothetical protein PIROE2DRAFT_67730 [Piromyces sp. E2]
MPEFPHPILRRKSSVDSDATSETGSMTSLTEKRVSFCENTDTYTMMSEEEYDRKSVPISRLYYKDYCELRIMRSQMIPGAYIFEC